MTKCQACGIDVQGSDRFCRNCGARVAVLLEDLADTHQFESAGQSAASANFAGASQVYSVPTSYPLKMDSEPSNTKTLFKRLLHSKLAWVALFLLLSVLMVSGLAIAREAARSRRIKLAEYARQADRATQVRQARQAERYQRIFEEAVQNALGFKPAAVPTAEYPDIRGIFVASLTSDFSPAALAHIQAGDVLVEMGGQPVPTSSDLLQVLDPLKPGADVAVKFYRDGTTVTSTIRIGDRSLPPLQPRVAPRDEGFLGVGNVVRRCCVPGTRQWGLEVRRLIDNSPADLAGLQLGDLITEFDGHVTFTPDEFSRLIHAAKPRTNIKVKFYRGNTAHTAQLLLGHGW